MSSTPIVAAVAFAVAVAASPAVLIALRRLQLLDHPNARSSHELPTPRGGGIAVLTAALIAASLAPEMGAARWPLVLTAAAFGVLGLADDLRPTPPVARLALQLLIAAAAIPLLLPHLRNATPAAQIVGLLLAIVWIAAFVNAFNFMDGINGISVAQTIVAGVGWAVLGHIHHVRSVELAGAIIAAAAAGFAPFNFPTARMFLGDVGSYFVGAWMAATVLIGLRAHLTPEAMALPLTLYLADTAVTIVRRLLRRERLHEAHRDHTYQQLVRHGWTHARTTVTIAGLIAALALLALAAASRTTPIRVLADAAAAAIVIAYLLLPTQVDRSRPGRPAIDASPTA